MCASLWGYGRVKKEKKKLQVKPSIVQTPLVNLGILPSIAFLYEAKARSFVRKGRNYSYCSNAGSEGY
jgi:hypothetical protein